MLGQRPNPKFKPWHGVVFFIIAIAALILGLNQYFNPQLPNDFPAAQIFLNEQTCADAGGVWDSCGSACRGHEDEACIQVCMEYCLCVSSNQCPYGFSCGNVYNGTGICIKSE